MITYIDAANANKYSVLFDKANKQLGLEENDQEYISSLFKYYAHLEALVSTGDPELNRFFARLPLDEDFLEIDANSRAIKVPASFARYGVGVQGDQMAEVVYFTIDRFFDSKDLAATPVNIVIQWEAKDENKETITGISKNFGKDVETIPGKIIFGWPISSELTAAAGKIKFVVRFYQTDGDTESPQLIYSFSTLPAEVAINATLDYDVIRQESIPDGIIDHGDMVLSRISSSGIYDINGIIPSAPKYIIDLHAVGEDYEGATIIDLPGDVSESIKLAICAESTDAGVINYKWYKFNYDPATGDYSTSKTELNSGAIEFVEVDANEEEINIENQYYLKETVNNADKYSLIASDRLANIESVGEEGEKVFEEDGTTIHLYRRIGSISGINSTGEYHVDIEVKAGFNAADFKNNQKITIPGPKTPSIPSDETEGKTIPVITNEGEATLTAHADFGAEIGENPNVALNYVWKHGNDVVSGATSASLALTDLVEDFTLDESYHYEVSATRNRATTDPVSSGTYRVTNAPKAPEIKDYTYVDGQMQPVSKRANNQYGELAFEINNPGVYDKITYLWMYTIRDEEEAWNEQQLWQDIDLDSNLSDIIKNFSITTDRPGEPDRILDAAVAEWSGTDPKEIVFNGATGAIEGEPLKTKYTLNGNSELGLYYCIIINELNGHKAATVGPFFNVY